MNKRPKVSVVTICFNQDKYIAETLESIVTQQTDFDFEAIVADDASTDKTPQIIKGYASKYPSIIKPILLENNIGAVNNSISALKAAKGKYVALCEGDDYWTDSKKLQMQVDFLEKKPDYALSFHLVKVVFEDDKNKGFVFPKVGDKPQFNVQNLLKNNFIQTNSVMYRRQNYDEMPNNILPLDWYLHLYHAQFGKIGFINRVMSAYRRHSGGVWWDSHSNVDKIWRKYGISHLRLYIEFLKLYGNEPKYKATITKALNDMFIRLILMDDKYSEKLMQQAATEFPEHFSAFTADQFKQIQQKDKEIYRLNSMIMEKDKEINMIKSSRVWKTRNQVAKAIGKSPI